MSTYPCLNTAVLALSFSIAFLDGTLFGTHASAMAFGFLFLFAEGVAAGQRLRSLLPGPARVAAITRHALIQMAGTGFVAVGAVSIWANKARVGKPHLSSLHARVGAAALILTAVAPLLGALSFKSLGLLQRVPERLHPAVKAAHRRVGTLAFVSALLAIEIVLTRHSVVAAKGALPKLVWQLGVAAAGVMALSSAAGDVPSGSAAASRERV